MQEPAPPVLSGDHRSETLLALNGVSVELGDLRVLNKVSLDVAREEIVTLVGPNGSGKTSFIKAALGLIPPSDGTIKRASGLRLGYMPQRMEIDHLMPLTVRRFVHIAGDAGWPDVMAALAQTGVEGIAQTQLHDISGGELQRVLLARAILRKPDLLVLDEPAQGVDVGGQAEMYRLITQLRDQLKCGVLMASHDLQFVMSSTDRVVCLNSHICCSGHPEMVAKDPEFLALFGDKYADAFAIYTHHHDHQHDLSGHIVEGKEKSS